MINNFNNFLVILKLYVLLYLILQNVMDIKYFQNTMNSIKIFYRSTKLMFIHCIKKISILRRIKNNWMIIKN